MARTAGINLLTRNEDFSACIPTRIPPEGTPTRRISIAEALEIADEFYKAQRAHARNAEYCRARRERPMPRRSMPYTAKQDGGVKNEG